MSLLLEMNISVQFITNLLEALGKFFVVWVTELSPTQLLPGNYSVVVSISFHSFIYKTVKYG